MKHKNSKAINRVFHMAAILPTAALSVGLTMTAPAAHAAATDLEEIIVTARRKEEVAQTVPISMTVFNQEALTERNVVNGSDLANYTPSLAVNNRFGTDQAAFAIRGFTQELRTTASVAVYFADVVAPRGGGANVTAGDGAGPGAFFDLQNVQVLKGPQGTLFGRNTTGGAIQLVPQKPTYNLEGYLEASAGNYNMKRGQGVINIPLGDSVRVRIGVDSQKRDGFLNNVSDVGPDHLANVNYTSGRASVVWDVTNSVENYTILTYTESKNHGYIQGLMACNPAGQLYSLCQNTYAKVKDDFYAVASGDEGNPLSKLQQWQAINNTTWHVNDAFTVKNLLSYAGLKQDMVSSNFGSNLTFPDLSTDPMFSSVAPGLAPLVGTHISMYGSNKFPGLHTNSQKTFVEELQFQGTAMDSKLNWQGGLYYENSKPDGDTGTISPIFNSCPPGSLPSADPSTWKCQDTYGTLLGSPTGTLQTNVGTIQFQNKAVYGQATYEFTDQFRLTGGARYTWDKTNGVSHSRIYSGFPFADLLPIFTTPPPAVGLAVPTYGPPNPLSGTCVLTFASLSDNCTSKTEQKSSAPTYMIDFDFLPTADNMIYLKYARGYRQGSVNIFGAEGNQVFEPEKVNAYEMGTKNSWHGVVPGTFNVSVFYNKLSNQQIQMGFTGGSAAATTGILNAGASTIKGVEVESNIQLLKGLLFNLSYTYLDTKLDSLAIPVPSPLYPQLIPAATAGGPLSSSPKHTVVAGLSYRLPLAEAIGNVSVGGSYTFMDEYLAAVGIYGTVPSHHLVNLNINWKGIAGSNLDASLFGTNVTNEEYLNFVPGLYDPPAGMEFKTTGEPRMYGARLRYNFK